MAAEEHLQIIQQGVDVWNEWRQKNPELIPDLSKANLNEAYLPYVDLHGAELARTSLRLADLSEADFSEAYLALT